MFDIKKILQRSWHILWNYRVLWVFGFILALAAGGANISNNSSYRMRDDNRNRVPGFQSHQDWEGLHGDTFAEKWTDAMQQMRAGIAELQAQHPREFSLGVGAAITFVVVILVLSVLTAVLRYVAEASTIRMVDEYEGSGVKVGLRQGWKYGWKRATWRVFWVNFLVHLPVVILLVVLLLLGWWVFSAWMGGVQSAIISSMIAGSGLAFLFIFITVILMVVLLVLRDLAWRMIVLDDAGTWEALRNAAGLAKRQWKNVGLMWLVMVGLKIAWMIAFFILLIPLMIVSIFTLIGGVLVTILPSLLTAGIASLLSAPDFWPWVYAAIVGLPFFLVVTFSPILLVGGWSYIFQSSVWTLTYRELQALETVAAEENPVGALPAEAVEGGLT